MKGKGESGATKDLVATNFPSRDFPQTLSITKLDLELLLNVLP